MAKTNLIKLTGNKGRTSRVVFADVFAVVENRLQSTRKHIYIYARHTRVYKVFSSRKAYYAVVTAC